MCWSIICDWFLLRGWFSLPCSLYNGKLWICRWFYTEASKEFVPFTGAICENFSVTQVMDFLVPIYSKIFVGRSLLFIFHPFKSVVFCLLIHPFRICVNWRHSIAMTFVIHKEYHLISPLKWMCVIHLKLACCTVSVLIALWAVHLDARCKWCA